MAKDNLWQAVFLAFIALYAVIMLISPQLAPTDDFNLLRTLQSGKPILFYASDFPYYDSLKIGRFTPLISSEYNIFGLFSNSPSPFWYFFFHAVQFIAFMYLFKKLISKATSNKWLVYGTPILLALTSGFAISWFRLQINERDAIFLFIAFALSFMAFSKNRKWIYFFLSAIFAAGAVYYKETAFLAVGAFALAHWFFTKKTADKKSKILDAILLLISISYLIAYWIFVVPHWGETLYGGEVESFSVFKLAILAKNFVNYGLFSDPILVILSLPILFWRLYKIFFKKEEAHPVYDPLLIAGSAYVLSYAVGLNYIFAMYGPYYLFPAYGLCIPPMIYFMAKMEKPLNYFWKIGIAVSAIALLFNVIPSGIHYITYYKYLSINFNKTLDFAVAEAESRPEGEKINIFLDGISRENGQTVYFIFSEFLRFKGLEDGRFDLKSNSGNKHFGNFADFDENYMPRISLPFSVFFKGETDEIKKGDYLIVTPQTPENINSEYIKSLEGEYELAFKTKSPLSFPNAHLKSLIKYFLIKFSQSGEGKLIESANLADWPDYYAFVKK
jgi:hypothetical protein